ncbi:MAG: NUDIX domain-containing protein [Phycisphaeraceae bacterium]
MTGPPIRTDIVDVYVFRRPPATGAARRGEVQFLQLHRALTGALPGTWHPIMGHMHDDETAARTALRELHEEAGYSAAAGGDLLGFWQLERVNSYFLHSHESIIISPCFAVEVAAPPQGREPTLNAEHDAVRWVPRPLVDRHFLWPGQRDAIASIVRDILEPNSPSEPLLRIDPATV